MIKAGWAYGEVLELDFDQVELYATEAVRQQDELLASLITVVNIGNHGKPSDIRRVIDGLTGRRQKPMSVDDLMKMTGKG